MKFNSFEFVFFFIVVYGIYRCLGHKGQNRWLLGVSYFFYGCWDWRFLLLLWLSTAVDYLCARQIGSAPNRRLQKRWLWAGLMVNISILGFFKYFNFFADNLAGLLNIWGIKLDHFTLQVVLPVGVSFYTFQSISYLVDVYLGRIKPERRLMDYALFVAFFPQLVAGPIERATHMLPQYKQPRILSAHTNQEGIWFIAWGFFLKIFCADNMDRLVNLVFNQNGPIPGVEVVLGSYAFAFQIFGDFAGYSFIAMGVARLLGIDLMANFRFPYFVTNPQEFWRHWHISLSQWLRDYLYIPLGGSRTGEWLTYRNVMITMFLGGLWHGAAWTFVIWGIYQGVLLVVHRIYRRVFVPSEAKGTGFFVVLKVIGMFQLTCIGWLIFRADSLEQLKQFILSLLFHWNEPSAKAVYLFSQLIFYSAFVVGVLIFQKRNDDLLAVCHARGLRSWFIYGMMFYLLVLFGEFGGEQFIYFQF